MVGGSRGLVCLVLSSALGVFAGGCTLGSDDGDTDSDGTSTGGVTAGSSEGSSEGSNGGSDSDTGDSSTGGSTDDTASTGGTTDDTASTGTTGEPTTDGTSDGTSSGGMGGYCDADDDWMGSWSTLEDEVVTIVNQRRAEGANCGSEGSFGPTGPLKMHPLLRCAARLHSKDMVDRDYFDHTNPDGESPWDRMAKTGYGSYSNAGENIAAGSPTAKGVVDQWMDSDGHCSNIMSPDFADIGVGYYPGGDFGHVWTQVFAKK